MGIDLNSSGTNCSNSRFPTLLMLATVISSFYMLFSMPPIYQINPRTMKTHYKHASKISESLTRANLVTLHVRMLLTRTDCQAHFRGSSAQPLKLGLAKVR